MCLWRAGGVCYHDNLKLHASIFTKLGLYVQVVTISSFLHFGGPAPPGRGSAAGGNFGSSLLQPSQTLCFYGETARARSVCISLGAFSFLGCVIFYVTCMFCCFVVLVRLSVPVQVIDWKDSSPK